MARRTVRSTTRGAPVRVLRVEPDRFLAGGRRHPGPGGAVDLGALDLAMADVTVDVIRPRDLVWLTFRAYGCDLVTGAEETALVPRESEDARLVVSLPFQHIAEAAVYEAPGRTPNADKPHEKPNNPSFKEILAADPGGRHTPPIEARAARGSRLVFAVPADERIEFSTEGLLAAMGRLRQVVHPLALPGEAPRPKEPGVGPTLVLPGGLLGTVTDAGLLVERAPRRLSPDTTTSAGLLAMARDLRRARRVLATETARVAGRAGVGQVVDVLGSHGIVPTVPVRPRRPRATMSRAPRALETAVEAPFRLVVSPSAEAAWAHSTAPVEAVDASGRVELWHSRLAWREEQDDGGFRVDEKAWTRRIVRAIWARDRDTAKDWQTKEVTDDRTLFRTSLTSRDRHMLVRQSAETWLDREGTPIPPKPVAARALWVSSLGAWLDFHGRWETRPYSEANLRSILLWDHVAPMGRDQFVRVVYPGYLYPFGHQAALVKITERKMKDPSPSLAGLYQRTFLVIGEPRRVYGERRLPLTDVRIRPLVTPTLDEPSTDDLDRFFWPAIEKKRFRFVLDAFDHEERPVRLVTPLLWVAEHFGIPDDVDDEYAADPDRTVAALGQRIAFAPTEKGGDTLAEVEALSFTGKAEVGGSRPYLESARVVLPAVQHVSPVGPVDISYSQAYFDHGFDGPGNAGQVWAAVRDPDADPDAEDPPPVTMAFGSTGAGSDRAGGFMQPNVPIRGLSRSAGAVGDVAKVAEGTFDPKTFLAGALPKLFGLVPLDELIAGATDLTGAPNVVSETLDRVEALIADLDSARAAVDEAVAEAGRVVAAAQDKAASVLQEAEAARAAAEAVRTSVTDAVTGLAAALGSGSGLAEGELATALAAPFQALGDAADEMASLAPRLPPLIGGRLQALAQVLGEVAAAGDIVQDVFRFLNGFDPTNIQTQFRFEWRPTVADWPSPERPFEGMTRTILTVKPDSLVLAVEGRASGKGGVGVEVLAELRDFALCLVPPEPLVLVPFEHLSFMAGSSGKAEVDIVMGDLEFLGILGFVQKLQEVIPFDGFSDPPYVDVTPEGLSAGFSLTLPSVAIGVFTLSNNSLSADVRVPFLGSVVTVGFGFCSREQPFTLAVAFLGGGGWAALRLSPDGLDILEIGLEAGATLSVDLGVASGSISAMVGVYMRLEGAGGSLTAYFRLRGEVDVLGLISASIELYLSLEYHFKSGKLVGRASITVEVDVFVFSGTVRIECERRFAGSNGDPTLEEVLAVEADGTSAPWSEYCAAFAEEH
jgi:hypothetical protein